MNMWNGGVYISKQFVLRTATGSSNTHTNGIDLFVDFFFSPSLTNRWHQWGHAPLSLPPQHASFTPHPFTITTNNNSNKTSRSVASPPPELPAEDGTTPISMPEATEGYRRWQLWQSLVCAVGQPACVARATGLRCCGWIGARKSRGGGVRRG